MGIQGSTVLVVVVVDFYKEVEGKVLQHSLKREGEGTKKGRLHLQLICRVELHSYNIPGGHTGQHCPGGGGSGLSQGGRRQSTAAQSMRGGSDSEEGGRGDEGRGEGRRIINPLHPIVVPICAHSE